MPPDQNFLKMNADVTISTNTGIVSFGAIMRDSKGHVICFAAGPLGNVTSILQVELMAIWECLVLAQSLGLRIIVCESDLFMAINAINSTTIHSLEGVVVNDILALLLLIEGGLCSHISRKKNRATHTLAQCSLGSTTCIAENWDNFPTCIRKCILINDFS